MYCIHECCRSVVVDSDKCWKVVCCVDVGLAHGAIIDENEDHWKSGYGVVLRYLLRNAPRKFELPFESLNMIADDVRRGAYDDDDCSAGWQEIGVHLCHTSVETVWNVSDLSW